MYYTSFLCSFQCNLQNSKIISSFWKIEKHLCWHFYCSRNLSCSKFTEGLWDPASQGSTHIQTQLQNGSRFTLSSSFSLVSFSSFTFRCTLLDFPSVSSLVFLRFFDFYLVVIILRSQHFCKCVIVRGCSDFF